LVYVYRASLERQFAQNPLFRAKFGRLSCRSVHSVRKRAALGSFLTQ
jgi:hypothetical protein